MNFVVGIDPGLSGAIALWDDGIEALCVWDMPVAKMARKNVIDEHELVSIMANIGVPDHAYIELVHAMPRQGTVSMFSFGQGFGIVKGIVAALAWPATYVSPQSWQAKMQVAKGKDASRIRASQLLPRYSALFQRVKDNGRSDAALIALFGAGQRSR